MFFTVIISITIPTMPPPLFSVLKTLTISLSGSFLSQKSSKLEEQLQSNYILLNSTKEKHRLAELSFARLTYGTSSTSHDSQISTSPTAKLSSAANSCAGHTERFIKKIGTLNRTEGYLEDCNRYAKSKNLT